MKTKPHWKTKEYKEIIKHYKELDKKKEKQRGMKRVMRAVKETTTPATTNYYDRIHTILAAELLRLQQKCAAGGLDLNDIRAFDMLVGVLANVTKQEQALKSNADATDRLTDDEVLELAASILERKKGSQGNGKATRPGRPRKDEQLQDDTEENCKAINLSPTENDIEEEELPYDEELDLPTPQEVKL